MNPKILLIFLLFHNVLVNSIDPSTLKLCEGRLCTSDCSNCNICDPNVCKPENNCQCFSQEIPGNLPLEDTPQFFFLTFDDILEKDTLYDISKTLDPLIQDAKIKDGLGCAVRPTFYVQSLGCQFALAPLYEKKYGGEIALHSVTHTTSSKSTDATWKTEIGQSYNDIKDLSSVKNLYGFRAPFLEVNEYYYKYLTENKILYDSSSSYYGASWRKDQTAKEQRNYWPFTLDYGFPDIDYCYSAVSCPTKSFPGIWEITMIGYVNSQGKEYVIMDYDYTTVDSFVADLKSQIQKNYDSNRAPLGLYFHSLYFLNSGETAFDPARFTFLQKMLQMVSETFPKLVFTTPARVINWMKNPKKFSELQANPDFTCVPRVNSWTLDNSCNDGKPVTSCAGSGSYLSYLICGQYCPNKFPDFGVNWDYSGGPSRLAQTTTTTTTTTIKQSSSTQSSATTSTKASTSSTTANPTTTTASTSTTTANPTTSNQPTASSVTSSTANPTTSNKPSSSSATSQIPTTTPTLSSTQPSVTPSSTANPTTSNQPSSSSATSQIPTTTPTSTFTQPSDTTQTSPSSTVNPTTSNDPSTTSVRPEIPTKTSTSTFTQSFTTTKDQPTDTTVTVTPSEEPTNTPITTSTEPFTSTKDHPSSSSVTAEIPTKTPTSTFIQPTTTTWDQPSDSTITTETPIYTPTSPIPQPSITSEIPTKTYYTTEIPIIKPTPTPIPNPGESLLNDLVKFEFVKQKSIKNSFCGSLIVNLEKVRNINSAIFTFAFCEKMGRMDLLYSVYRNQKFQRMEEKNGGIRIIKAVYKDLRIRNMQKAELLSFCISGAPYYHRPVLVRHTV